LTVQPGEGRVMTVFIAQGWMRWPLRCRARELADYGWNVREPRAEGDQTPARKPCKARKREAGSGGRFKCMSGRQSVRTRRRVDKSDNSWGHAADRSNPSACGTQAFPASKAAIRRVLSHTDATCSRTWRRGRGETPCRSARPLAHMRKAIEFQDRRALKPDKIRGDDACLDL